MAFLMSMDPYSIRLRHQNNPLVQQEKLPGLTLKSMWYVHLDLDLKVNHIRSGGIYWWRSHRHGQDTFECGPRRKKPILPQEWQAVDPAKETTQWHEEPFIKQDP